MEKLYLDTDAPEAQLDPDSIGITLFSTRSRRFQIMLSYSACLVGVVRAIHVTGQSNYVLWIGPVGIIWFP